MPELAPYQPAPYGVVDVSQIDIDHSLDKKLTTFSLKKLESAYLRGDQKPQERFAALSAHYGKDVDHARRIYKYISNLWFMPATPILSNGGTTYGLPASCFVNEPTDTLHGIVGKWNENVWLASRGGGIGSYYGNLRSSAESVGKNGHSSGSIPFIHVMDSLTLAISQGCVDGDTEILTEGGFVKFSELDIAHGRVWQVDHKGIASLVTPSEYHTYPYKGVMHHYITTDAHGDTVLEQFVTPNHRLVKTDHGMIMDRISTDLEIVQSEDFVFTDKSSFVRLRTDDVSGISGDSRIAHTLASFENTTREDVDFDGTVYCVSVPSGMFIARKNGTVCVTGNSLRRGSAAVYMPVWHPEIEEFIEMRRPTGGDPNRKNLNLHHGVVLSNAFMRMVMTDGEWELRSPKDGAVIKRLSARSIWQRLLLARLEQGEPYILWEDQINERMPHYQRESGLYVKTSNLCSEITLPTGIDHHGRDRTAVCFLSSLNLETHEEWKDNSQFIEDIMYFLDAVVQDLIDNAPPEMAAAVYGAYRERAVGLGVMGFHTFLQQRMIPFESIMAKVWNRKIFKEVRGQADAASIKIASERGSCPDAAEHGIVERFACKMAVAPTASISIICGETSPGIDPIASCYYLQKSLTGNQSVKNKYLVKLLKERDLDTDEIWTSIQNARGSVQHLDCLSQSEKDVFKTAFELDQRWIIEHAADRTPFICQSQPVNLFLPPNIHKRDLHGIHALAWEKGLKSLYYCRSYSLKQADTITGDTARTAAMVPSAPVQYDECLACQ